MSTAFFIACFVLVLHVFLGVFLLLCNWLCATFNAMQLSFEADMSSLNWMCYIQAFRQHLGPLGIATEWHRQLNGYDDTFRRTWLSSVLATGASLVTCRSNKSDCRELAPLCLNACPITLFAVRHRVSSYGTAWPQSWLTRCVITHLTLTTADQWHWPSRVTRH